MKNSPAEGSATSAPFTLNDEAAATSEYRALCPHALIAIALGLVSLAAFASPLFWILPVVGVGFGIWALRVVQTNADRYTGNYLAWGGLALALLALGWAPTRQLTRMSILEGKARQLSDHFVQLICDARLHEAHQLHLHASDRAPLDADLKTYYAADSQKERLLNDFYERSVLKQWLALGTDSQAKFVRVSSSFAFSNQEEILFEYEIASKSASKSQPIQAFVVIARERMEGTGQHELYVSGVIDLDPFLRRSL